MISAKAICQLIVVGWLFIFAPSVLARAPLYVKGEWKLTLSEHTFTMTINQQKEDRFSGSLDNGDLIVDGRVTGLVIEFTRKPSDKTEREWPQDNDTNSKIREQHIKITLKEYVTLAKWGLMYGAGTWDGYHATGPKLEAHLDQIKEIASIESGRCSSKTKTIQCLVATNSGPIRFAERQADC